MKRYLTIFTLNLAFGLSAQVNFESSNLPILVIETVDGQEIPNEPKITANLGIIWNGEGEMNDLDDPFNNYDGFIGIERRGSSSQFVFPKNGFAMETRLPDGENNNVSILGLPEENDWVLNGPYSDKTLMRNALAYTMAGWIMDYAPRVKFCELFINDEYQGVYFLTEKIKRDKNRVDISKLNPDEIDGDDVTGGYILKFDKFEGATFDGFISEHDAIPGFGGETVYQFHYPKPGEIVPEQMEYIENFIDDMEDVLASDEFYDPVNGYRKYFDMEELFEFIFINEIARNVDGYRLSTYFHKDRESINGKIKMGPVWDFNLGFGNVNYCIGPEPYGWAILFNDVCPADTWAVHFWWNKMWEDPIFREDAANYWAELRADKLSDENIFGLVDSLRNILRFPAVRNFQRWPVMGEYVWPNGWVENSYDSEVFRLREWLEERLEWMDNQIPYDENTDPGSVIFPEPIVYPNPTNGEIYFEYTKKADETVHIRFFDIQGKYIDTISDDDPAAGNHKTTVDFDLPNGLYQYEIIFSRGKTVDGRFLRQ